MTRAQSDHVPRSGGAETGDHRGLAARAVQTLAGPALIIAGVLAILHDFAFGGMVTTQYRDLLQFWLPTHCVLGRTLAGGEMPMWNSLALSGHPFAADPQSGWTYLPVMALYAALPCEVAITLFIPLQPIVAGLGLYWFLRSEGLSRVSATVAGLAISLGLSASRELLALPYTGALAWTAVTLALASRFMRARTWAGRFAWGAGCAIAWGQIAAAHLSHGFILGSCALAIYAVARTISDVRTGVRRVPEALAALGTLAAILVPVNAAVLLPRLVYLDRTSLSLGYSGIEAANARLWPGSMANLIPARASEIGWPLRWGTSPGMYLGAVPLAMAFAGWFRSGRRYLVLGFSALGLLSYLGTLRPVVRALAPLVTGTQLGDLYLRGPNRLAFGVLLALPIVSAAGLEAWLREQRLGRRIAMLAPALVVWGLLWIPLRIPSSVMLLPALGAGAAVVALAGARAYRPLGFLVPCLLAVELVSSALSGFRYGPARRPGHSARLAGAPRGEDVLLQPDVPAADAVTAPPVVHAMVAGVARRFAWLAADAAGAPDGGTAAGITPGIQRHLTPLFGLEDALGYNPTQPLRFWTFVRTVSTFPMPYNRSYFHRPPPGAALQLLDIEWLVSGPDEALPRGWAPVASEGRRVLYRGPSVPRAAVYSSWSVAASPEDALEVVVGELDPSQDLVVEETDVAPAMGVEAPPVPARYRWVGSRAADVEVNTRKGGMLLVRNSYDEHWRAEVDGHPVAIVPADYFLQGIPVPAGRHIVTLRYDDPLVTGGLVASGATLALLFSGAVVLWSGRRRVRRG